VCAPTGTVDADEVTSEREKSSKSVNSAEKWHSSAAKNNVMYQKYVPINKY
jgi:hypothetical protein